MSQFTLSVFPSVLHLLFVLAMFGLFHPFLKNSQSALNCGPFFVRFLLMSEFMSLSWHEF